MTEWLSVKEAAEYAKLSERHIRHLLSTGQLEGRRLGHYWYTTKEAIDKYKDTDPRPGPKPKK